MDEIEFKCIDVDIERREVTLKDSVHYDHIKAVCPVCTDMIDNIMKCVTLDVANIVKLKIIDDAIESILYKYKKYI